MTNPTPIGTLLLAALLAPATRAASPDPAETAPPRLLGRIERSQLEGEPYSVWFRPGYDGYEPNAAVLDELRHVGHRGVSVSLFFGTWCGDSRREVPRLLKLLDRSGFDPRDIRLIAVDDADEALKRSPGGEEQGLEIYRVPTTIVWRDGAEAGRIVEFPARSLERDLLAILAGQPYRPSYSTYPVVRRWLGEGLLADPNVSARGLADEVRSAVASEGELAAAARVMLARGQIAEAVKLYQVNCALNPESARCQARLCEALLRAGDRERAREAAEHALRLNIDTDRVGDLLDLLGRAREETPPAP